MSTPDLATIYASLEQEYSWRIDEIRLLRNQLSSMTEDDRKRYRKSLVTMLYSHFEGFCYTSLAIYVDTLNSLSLKRADLNTNLAIASLAQIFKDYENKEKKSAFFTKHEDKSIHHFHRQVELITELDGILSETAVIPPIVVDTESNIGPEVLKKILFKLGFPHNVFDIHKSDILQLLNARNDIAHGKMKSGVEEKDYNRIEKATLATMRGIISLIMDSLTNNKYKKITTTA